VKADSSEGLQLSQVIVVLNNSDLEDDEGKYYKVVASEQGNGL